MFWYFFYSYPDFIISQNNFNVNIFYKSFFNKIKKLREDEPLRTNTNDKNKKCLVHCFGKIA